MHVRILGGKRMAEPLPGPLRAAPGERFGHTFSAEDPDVHSDKSNDKLTWKLLSGDFPGHTWNEREGTLIWTPHPAYEGPPITGEVDVEDGRGGRDSLVFTVEVLR